LLDAKNGFPFKGKAVFYMKKFLYKNQRHHLLKAEAYKDDV
jgi:hypothetical protein